LVPVGSGYTYGRRLSTDSATGKTKIQLRTADDALNDRKRASVPTFR
jgi:hypothetical protein